MKKIIAFILLACLVLTALIGCDNAEGPESTTGTSGTQTDTPEASKYGGTLNLAWKGNGSDSLDPYSNTGWLTYIWSLNVFETAISRDANGNYVPCICDFELSEDNLELKLWVRDGVKFHNGEAVTIDDVVYSLVGRRGENDADNVTKYFKNYIESYDVKDGVATFKFDSFNANTMYYISGYATFAAIMPKAIQEKYILADSFINSLDDIIGTGPYKLNVKNTELGRVVALDRFDDYVATTLDCDGLGGPKKAYFDKINVFFNSEENSIAMSLMNGDYDIGSVSGEFSDLLATKNIVSTPDLGVNISYIAFNTSEGRIVTDENLRKACAAAIDYASVMQAVYGKDGYTLDNCPMEGSYKTDVFSTVDYYGKSDLDLAKSYLAKSSYKGEVIKIAAKSSDKASVVIESYLKQAGINCEINYMDDSSFNSYYADLSNDYDMLYLSSAKCDSIPSSMVTNLRTRFWNDSEASALFKTIGAAIPGGAESTTAWKTMSEKWAADAHIILLGASSNKLQHNADLVFDAEGTWRYFFNSYWKNPSQHK